MMMTIALRFIPTLLQEAQVLLKAQRSRGAHFSAGNPARWAKGLLPLFVPLFAGALRRAEDLATAMEPAATGVAPTGPGSAAFALAALTTQRWEWSWEFWPGQWS
ncbi:MAG: energy-coupling factor transporter transmembrane component T [Peptococcaceae bacterium MAG4]|nr:energy-coupling factor transporter transmembrane component T [Peptococcaceae bacterium MAG4]